MKVEDGVRDGTCGRATIYASLRMLFTRLTFSRHTESPARNDLSSRYLRGPRGAAKYLAPLRAIMGFR